MVIVGGETKGSTVMVIALLVPVGWLLQSTFEVSMHDTTSEFAKELIVKVVLLVPTLAPFTCH